MGTHSPSTITLQLVRLLVKAMLAGPGTTILATQILSSLGDSWHNQGHNRERGR